LALEKVQKELKQFEEEGKVIQDAVAKFGVFLKHNAIVSFPDSLDEYMELSLRIKRKDLENTRRDEDVELCEELKKEINELEERREKYRVRKRTIEDSMKKKQDNENAIITADDVHKLKDKLMNLEYSGKQIEQVLSAQTLSAHEFQEYVVKRAQSYNPTLAGARMRIVQRKNKKHNSNDGRAGFWTKQFNKFF